MRFSLWHVSDSKGLQKAPIRGHYLFQAPGKHLVNNCFPPLHDTLVF